MIHNLYLELCAVVEQTNTTPKKICLVVCNGDGTGTGLKPDQL